MSEVQYKNGKNTVKQIVDNGDCFATPTNVVASWNNSVSFLLATQDNLGLRSPQQGALFAIKAHWTVSREPATIVMPTGTGKTETMIAAIVSEQIQRTLVIVPSNLLRRQTVDKVMKFGVLRDINVISDSAILPAVATLSSAPKTVEDLRAILEKANVIVTTVSLLQRFSAEYFSVLSEMCNVLIVDEAHHIAAKTWSSVKHALRVLPCLQFTATPFRNDGKKLDGKIIYNFPLSMAQKQGYFQKINYRPIWEFDEEKGDLAIATAAVEQLVNDLENGYEHAVLVRAKDKKSADRLFNEVYSPLFPQHSPVLIHSGISPTDKQQRMDALKEGRSRIVVCVDMFGEGIDIPNLKIAAVHDKYKSLPITLQFVGRFARTSAGLGEATLITNIANDELNESLEELYAQDADWNKLLGIKSASEIGRELLDQEFEQGFGIPLLDGLSIQQIRPKVSTTVYVTGDEEWQPRVIEKLFDPEKYVYSMNAEKNVIVVIERTDTRASWSSFKGISDTTWDLHLAYWNTATKLLYVNSTNKGFSDEFAHALFNNCRIIKGESVFRCLHGIKRLMLGTVGLLSGIDGPIRFKMFAGIDVEAGISESLKQNSSKSNLFGVGYNGKGRASIGCSHKGRIWSRWVESISYWMNWCNEIGECLLDDSIDTKTILSGVLVPEIVSCRPDSLPYSIEWPQDLDIISEDRIEFQTTIKSYPYHSMDICLVNPSVDGTIAFAVKNEEVEERFEIQFAENEFAILTTKAGGLTIQVGRKNMRLAEFFKEYPPIIRFVDQSSIEGNCLIRCSATPPIYEVANLVALDWSGTDIRKESQTQERFSDSIQYRIIHDLINSGEYSVIFDDDGSGEIADVVTIKELENKIVFGFYHCKYASADKPGARIDELYAVCGQAEKSIRWCGRPRELIERLIKREKDRSNKGGSRIEVGSLQKLRKIYNKLRLYPVEIGITIVQPGVDSQKISPEMLQLLGVTSGYLLDTYGITLKVLCS